MQFFFGALRVKSILVTKLLTLAKTGTDGYACSRANYIASYKLFSTIGTRIAFIYMFLTKVTLKILLEQNSIVNYVVGGSLIPSNKDVYTVISNQMTSYGPT